MLKTGIHSAGYFGRHDLEKYNGEGFRKIKAHGYDCIDYSELSSLQSPIYTFSFAKYKSYLTELGKTVREAGLEISQMHGLWPTAGDTEISGREKNLDYFKKEIEGAAYLRCPKIVIHPCMAYGWASGTKEQMFEVNVNLLTTLLPYAKTANVTLCLENMPFRKPSAFSDIQELKDILMAINSPFVKACLDTGHLVAMGDSMYESICILGEDLAALHVHDDVSGQDRHLLPFQGQNDWQGFIKGLRDIRFNGCISLETNISLATPQPMLEEMQISLAKIARYFIDEIEK